ncbi:putative transcriptional regulator [Streptococcus satellite phage Javan250]|uniref:DNA-binding protein n=1 Tax=Streptococcus halotolerans TaxID=1814128 RepID=UPI0007898E23|nr:DNA-binding protein [Streptococcus halotolerans]QBX08353.1 putative transcriptional regulator [Streptococcus satellite phage Javan250]
MLITKDIAQKVKIKRAKRDMTKTALSDCLSVSRKTLAKIEAGDYDAPKRIYQSVMSWLVEDL